MLALEYYLLQQHAKQEAYYDRLRRELGLDVCALLDAFEGTIRVQSARGFYADSEDFTTYDDPYATAPIPDIITKSGGLDSA